MKILNLSILLFLALFTLNSLQAQTQLNLLGVLPYTDGLNDIWGYETNGNEYAIVGLNTGVSIVNVTVPSNPIETQFIPHVTTTWRDIKTYNDWAYVINEAQDGLMIIDLSTLPGTCSYNFWSGATQNYQYNGSSFVHTDAHNIYIDEFGYGYLFGGNAPGGGALIIDIAANPSNPTIVGHYDVSYCHDGYARNNILYTAEIYNGWFGMVDVSNKANIGSAQILGTGGTTLSFTHNVWISDDGNYAFTTDEKSGAEVGSFDISNPANIQRLTGYNSSPGSGVIPHNTHVKNDFLYTSYYADGVTVVCANNPRILTEVGYYDTSTNSGSTFSGCWGAYPFLPSGIILATDRQNGLHILDNNYGCSANIEGIITDQATGAPINNATVSFNPAINIYNTDIIGYYGVGTASNNGTYTITVSAPGYNTYTATVNLIDCQTINEDIALNANAACPAVTFTGLPSSIASSSPISLTGSPAGGTFSGPGVIFNAFNPSVVGTGFHAVTYNYNDANGCSGSSTQQILVFTISYNFVNYSLGTISPKEVNGNDISHIDITNVYPNPADDNLNVELYARSEDSATLYIYSMNGQIVKTVSRQVTEGLNKLSVNLTDVPKGNYLVEVKTSMDALKFKISK